MKRVVAITLFAVASLSMTSCDAWGSFKEWCLGGLQSQEQQEQSPHEKQIVHKTNHPGNMDDNDARKKNNASKVRIYSNAYDGFVNVRRGASLKSAILGKLRNGNDYLVQLGTVGNWIMVDWYGTVGYVNKSVVGPKPWKPTYLGVDSNWIAGWYYDGHRCLLIFDNGKFMDGTHNQDTNYGTWRFEGNEIVLTTKYVTEGGRWLGRYIGEERRDIVDVKNRQIGHTKKQILYPDSYYAQFEDEHFGGERVVSKERFYECKQMVNKLVRWK